MSAPVVATVQAVVGNVIAVNQDGDIRVLKAGDVLFQDETIKTAPEASVTVLYATGVSQTIGADANFTLHLSLLSFLTDSTALAHMDPTAVAFRTALLADSDPKKVFAALHVLPHEGSHSAYVRPYIDPAADVNSGYPTQGLGSTPTFSSDFVSGGSPSRPSEPTWDEPMYTPPLTVSAPLSFDLNEANLANGSQPDVYATTVSQTFSLYAGSDPLTHFAFSTDLSYLTTDLNNNASPDIFWVRVSDTQIKGFLDAGHNQLAITLDLQAPASIDAWGEGDAQVTATLSDHLSHAAGNGAQIGDLGAVQVEASDGVDTVTATLLLGVQDDVPTAVNDTGSVTEDGASSIGGNVLDNDQAGADSPKSFASWGSGDGVAIATLNIYGTLTQNNDGSWSYVLDNSRATTQALTNTDSHDYVLHYTMQDADGDTSEATLTITIHGTDDSASLTTVSAMGINGTVYEHGLVTHDDSQTTTNGTFSISASDGIHDVVIGGALFNWDQIHNFANQNGVVNTTDGVLTLTNYSGDNYNGTISYSYTLPAAVSNDNTGYFDDNIALAVNGVGGSTASDNLVIRVMDDTPSAVNDSASVTEDATPNTISGNVLSNDSAGADTPMAFVAWSNSDSAAISALNTYGTLTQNNNGSWNYVLDNSRSATQALTSANTLNYDLHYSIQDADGSISSAKLTITVQGADDGSSVTTAQASGLDGTVYEHGLVAHDGTQTVTGSFIITASDNIASVTIGGTTFSWAQIQAFNGSQTVNTGEGVLTLTSYSGTASAGTINYSYTLSAAINNATKVPTGNDTVDSTGFNDSIALTVSGVGGSTASDNLVIRAVDDTPTAVNDTLRTVAEDVVGTISGNVLSNDTQSADNATVVSHINLGSGWVALTSGTLVGGYYTFTNSAGTYGFKADGSWTFDPALNQNNASGMSANFNYRITDGDGDTSEALQAITVMDGTPAANAAPITLAVNEAALSTGSNPSLTTETATTSLSFTAGSDNLTSFAFSNTLSGLVTDFNGDSTQDVFWVRASNTQVKGYLDAAHTQLAVTLNLSAPASIAAGGTGSVSVTMTLSDNLPHPTDNGAQISSLGNINVVVTDIDGNTATGTVNMTVQDDVPTLTIGTVSESGITLATQDAQIVNGATDTATASFASTFLAAVTANYGADGAGSTGVGNYTLTVNSSASGLTSGGLNISLYLINGVVTASTAATQGGVNAGNTIFSISVDNAGLVTLSQFSQIDHLGTGNGTQIALANGKVTLSATATVTDSDGDATTATVSADLGGNVRFDDDVPTLAPVAVDDSSLVLTTQDADTIGPLSDMASANYASAFLTAANVNYGGDSVGATAVVSNYALAVNNSASGFTAGGLGITLYLINGVVTGSTAGSRGGVSTTNTIFNIAVDNTGQVTLTQFSQLDHTGAGNNAQLVLASNKVSLSATVTVTDGDGDTATANFNADLGGNIRFDDSVPTLTVGTVNDSSVTLTTQDANTIGVATDTASASFASAFLAAVTPNYNADGAGSTVVNNYSLAVNSATSGLSSGGASIFLYLINGVVTGSTAAVVGSVNTANTIFSISVNTSGTVTLNQFSQIDHVGTGNNTQIALADGKVTLSATATVTDYDGDTATATVSADLGGNIRFNDDVPVAPTLSLNVSVINDETAGVQSTADPNASNDIAGASVPSAVKTAFDGLGTVMGYAASSAAAVNVTANYGADGPANSGAMTYALSVTNGTFSGVSTTGGTQIFLYNGATAGYIVGRVGTEAGVNDTPNAGGAVAFAFTVDSSTGVVYLAQYLSLYNPTAGSTAAAQDDQITLTSTAVQMAVTLTDADGDTNSSTIGIGSQIGFQDDSPTIGTFTSMVTANTVGSATGSFSYTAGADGLSQFNITGPSIAGVTYTQTAQANGTTILTAKVADGTTVFTLTAAADSTYTYNLVTPQATLSSSVSLTTLVAGNSTFAETSNGLIEFSTTSGNTINSSTQGFGVNDQRVAKGEQFTVEFHTAGSLGVDDPTASNPQFVKTVSLNYADVNLGNKSSDNFLTFTWTAVNSTTNQTATGTITITSSAAGSLYVDPGFTFNLLTIQGTDGVSGSGKGARFVTEDYTYQVFPTDTTLQFNVAAVDGDGDVSATQTLSVHQVIAGTDGSYTLAGTSSAETLVGHAGVNIADYSSSTSAISINLDDSGNASGAPTTFSSPTDGTISGGDATGDTLSNIQGLIGGSGNDYLFGNSSANTLTGGLGNDTINGEGGNDTIIGGKGDDTLTGGTGKDTFIWQSGDQGTSALPAKDTITDFSMTDGDVLNLSGLLIGATTSNLSSYLSFAKGTGPNNSGNTILSIDIDGAANGASVTQQITFQGVSMSQLAGGGSNPTSADVITHLLATHQLVVS